MYQTKHNKPAILTYAPRQTARSTRGTSRFTSASDAAVEATAGLLLYYGGGWWNPIITPPTAARGKIPKTYGLRRCPYLRGKAGPYEASITIPNYSYEKTYTADELTSLLQKKGYDIGTVASVEPTYTAMGNIYTIEFTDTAGEERDCTQGKLPAAVLGAQHALYHLCRRRRSSPARPVRLRPAVPIISTAPAAGSRPSTGFI